MDDRWTVRSVGCPRCGRSFRIPGTGKVSGPARKKNRSLLFLLLLAVSALGYLWFRHPLNPWRAASGPTPAGNPATADCWDIVWNALQAAPPTDAIPASAIGGGAPLRKADKVLFRFVAPPDAEKVFLAGSFNQWADNDHGRIADDRFAMRRSPAGTWYQWVELPAGTYSYQYVAQNADGGQKWMRDPYVSGSDAGGNTTLDFSTVASLRSSPWPSALPLRGVKLLTWPETPDMRLDVRPGKVWVQPGQPNVLIVKAGADDDSAGARLNLQIETPLGEIVHISSQDCESGENRLSIPSFDQEGGFVARVSMVRGGQTLEQGMAILSVVRNVADDLRYGFYSNYPPARGDYSAKAAMLASLHINAVEFYDYSPANGDYSPQESHYRSEPFGVQIDAQDVRRKIDADRAQNILSLAYVAAYAATESVYQKYPYPMTDERGAPKIFNGRIMTEDEAEREGKPTWFHLMNVADDSPWQGHILGEFGRCLEEGHLLTFDGFEIDTYGDSPGAIFYAPNSRSNGERLSEVLHNFVGKVRSLTHAVRPEGLVTFNSVNEFGIDRMHDVTDFLFLEIWRDYADRLDQIVDICFRDREPNRERVILKMYPADMRPSQNRWPPATLRRLLGAAMTGGGSLMVAGEPDEGRREMHGLNSLYYPDNQALLPETEEVLRAYYRHDAMLLGYTHGQGVFNTNLRCSVPDCITRTSAAPAKRCLIVKFLHAGPDERWTADVPPPAPKTNCEISFALPGGVPPRAVYFATPDVPALETPVRLNFDATAGRLRTLLPELAVYGTLIIQY